MSQKSEATKAAPVSPAPPEEYSPEEYERALERLHAMREHRIFALFDDMASMHLKVAAIEAQLVEVAGSREELNRKLLLRAVTNAGKVGLPLNDARRYVRDPNELAAARMYLTRVEDETGEPVEPLIIEKRGKNNEVWLYLTGASASNH